MRWHNGISLALVIFGINIESLVELRSKKNLRFKLCNRTLVKRVYQKLIFLFLNQNICYAVGTVNVLKFRTL